MPELPEITLGERSVRIDADEFGFDEITSVSYLRLVTRGSGVITNLTRRFEIEAPGRHQKLNLDGSKELVQERQELWRTLVQMSQQWIEPRLCDEALERIRDHGETVEIGRVELDPSGFGSRMPLRGKHYEWATHARTFFQRGQIKIAVKGNGDTLKNVIALGTEVPNAVLLPRLMVHCVRTFTAPDATRA